MSPGLDPGALLARYYALPAGLRVCLRLARPRDRAGIRRLLRAHGRPADELELTGLVGFDVTRHLVLVATALIGTADMVVGVGATELTEPAPSEPSLLLVADGLTEGLDRLLADALVAHAAAISRARAA